MAAYGGAKQSERRMKSVPLGSSPMKPHNFSRYKEPPIQYNQLFYIEPDPLFKDYSSLEADNLYKELNADQYT